MLGTVLGMGHSIPGHHGAYTLVQKVQDSLNKHENKNISKYYEGKIQYPMRRYERGPCLGDFHELHFIIVET